MNYLLDHEFKALQKRTSPRRRSRFTVTFCPVGSREFRVGQCLDIGGGGMLLKIPAFEPLPEHLTLQFRLPCADGETMQLCGRVMRSEPCETDADSLEIALCFERLTVAQGMTLCAFLSE